MKVLRVEVTQLLMEETEVGWVPLVIKPIREENLTLSNICLLFQAATSILFFPNTYSDRC